MKTVVSVQDLLEGDIKPSALLADYVRLTEESVGERWRGGRDFVEAACPGCSSRSSRPAFTKIGMAYRTCEACGSVYVSPRPAEAALLSYYREAPAARFWRERVLPETGAARQEKLVEPRAQWVLDGMAEYAPGASRAIDLSPHGSALAAYLQRESKTLRIDAHATSIADLGRLGPVDLILAFDAFDRSADVVALVGAAGKALRPGGLLFVTAPSMSGFDLQVLWERSTAILPPDKLNLLSAEGWLSRFAAPAWDILEFSTPGMFDVENVRRAVLADPSVDWPRFVRTLVHKDEAARREFQAYLQQFRLASFARLVVRRAS